MWLSSKGRPLYSKYLARYFNSARQWLNHIHLSQTRHNDSPMTSLVFIHSYFLWIVYSLTNTHVDAFRRPPAPLPSSSPAPLFPYLCLSVMPAPHPSGVWNWNPPLERCADWHTRERRGQEMGNLGSGLDAANLTYKTLPSLIKTRCRPPLLRLVWYPIASSYES